MAKSEVTEAEIALVNLIRGINNADENEVELLELRSITSKVNAYNNCYNEALALYEGIIERMKGKNNESR